MILARVAVARSSRSAASSEDLSGTFYRACRRTAPRTGAVSSLSDLCSPHDAYTSTTASTKAALRALARRWLALDAEIKAHDAHLDALTAACTPTLRKAYGISPGTAAEMLILVGDQPDRIRSEAAFAKLCGACPIPASSGKTIRYRLNRGGNRQANAALYRVVIVRMRSHPPTLAYVRRRRSEGKTKLEIIRCLKRFVAREIFGYLCGAKTPPTTLMSAP